MAKVLGSKSRLASFAAVILSLLYSPSAQAATEADIRLPSFSEASFPGLGGISGQGLLLIGMVIAALGLALSLLWLSQIRKLPVHKAMLEISELIFETCKTYLATQIKFILLLEAFVAVIIVAYFGVMLDDVGAGEVLLILLFTLIGIAGSAGIALFGIRVNTYANSRSAFASLKGKPYPTYEIPLKAGMSIGMALISIELLLLLSILLLVPGDLAGRSFIGFAIGASLGASALRIAGGIFTKIADIGADLMKIVFNIKEDDARNPGVIADCAGDNAGDSVGPSADGFETYGVTAVALIAFITLAVAPSLHAHLIVWIFILSVAMLVSSAGAYFINQAITRSKSGDADSMNFEEPLTRLVWITSLLSIAVIFLVSALVFHQIGSPAPSDLWWRLSIIISCGTLAGALIPEVIKVFTSTQSRHVGEVVAASREGGASLNILAGLTAGNFSAYWMGLVIVFLMGLAWFVSSTSIPLLFEGMSPEASQAAAAVFAFGLVAFGFLSMGPVTVAVDSYGPVTDNAQSVYELSLIEDLPGIEEELRKDFGFTPNFDVAKHHLEENDGAGNTFKATAKPVLIGTAVVGVTTLIFSLILSLTDNLNQGLYQLSVVNPMFLFGLILGGAVIYWFSGAATQAVSTGAYRAVEFIKANIQLEGVERASTEDSKKVVEICTQYAQKGMLNIFIAVFFSALAFSFVDPFLFIGYLIAIAIFGLYQALFMANAGGAWDNAKKIVEVDLQEKGTDLHAATVVGDTVGDPFKDTSSVALNPVIKFTTLFGLLAVPLALGIENLTLRYGLAIAFFLVSTVFVYRSFYNMRIENQPTELQAKTSHS